MYVCLCKGVSHRTIRRCIDEGARSIDEVGRRCGAGTSCGACRPDIGGMLADASRACEDELKESAEQLAAK